MTSSRNVALLILLMGCGAGSTDTIDGGVDARPPFDWTVDGLPPIVIGCGDGRVDLGESCDDANDVAGDRCASCRWVSLCGDGARTGSEACDDGNATNGDGCRASCEVETCGDGYVDAPTEACDAADATCSMCDATSTCGDGVEDAFEQCDDGNTSDWDGCTSSCAPEQVFVISKLGFATEVARGCDVTGTGVRQNAIGGAFSVVAPLWNAYIASQFRDVTRRPAIGFSGLVRGEPAPARFRVAIFDTQLVDALARVVVRSPLPFDYMHAAVEGLEVVSETADVQLQTAGAVTVQEPLRRAQLRLSSSPELEMATRFEGVLCGALEASSLARAEDPLGLGVSGGTTCATLTRPTSLADLIAGGRSLGFIATPVDVDLDGDGLELLIVAGVPQDDCTPVVAGCVEGDGTVSNDPSCIFDFDDGWSVSLSLVAERATFGIAP